MKQLREFAEYRHVIVFRPGLKTWNNHLFVTGEENCKSKSFTYKEKY